MVWIASIVVMGVMVALAAYDIPATAATCPAPVGGKDQTDATRYMDDIASRQRWAIVPDCQHPEWPAKLVAVPPTDPAAKPLKAEPLAPPRILVRAGTHVVLWRDSESTRLALDAVALGDGAMGSVISLRLVRGGAMLLGRVRGAGSAELQPAGRTERLP